MRKVQFANGEYYHIYNRGVDKRDVFLDDEDYLRFLTALREFNTTEPIGSLYEKNSKFPEAKPPYLRRGLASGEESDALVEIVCYCLNPNHFHLILKQLQEKGISKFMLKVSTGYTMFFNNKYERSGSLFQGVFKAIHIDSNEYLLYLSAYVNGNNFIHGYDKDNDKEAKPPRGGLASENLEWKYCSALDYIGKRNGTLCKKDVILDQFADSEFNSGTELNSGKCLKRYAEFLNKNALHLKERKQLEKYLLE